MKSIILATTAVVLAGGSAMAAPYVESKTTAGASITDGESTYKGTQTELRIGYEAKAAKNVTVYGEVGPGYEWNTGKTQNETVAVGEVGVKAKLAPKVGVAAKVTGEYGNLSKTTDIGGELKVRYSF